MTGTAAGRLEDLRARSDEMLDLLRRVVDVDSPSVSPEATSRCAEVIAQAARRLLRHPFEVVEVAGRAHLRLRGGSSPRVLLLGHFDTVWPLGTTDRWPFGIAEGRATGPGVFDMKAGIVQMLFALATLDGLDGISVLLTGDEEIGSPTSRELIEDAARAVDAALVLEPSANGALKTSRKGGSSYEIRIHGRAAHAGLNPEDGINAAVELAHQILQIADLAAPERGTTITPTVAAAGTTGNTVPASASLHVDVRVPTSEEQARVDRAIGDLRPVLPGARVEVACTYRRPPLPSESSAELFAKARSIAESLGLPPLLGADVGGGSDGNLTAAVGTPTLDGLGAVGGNAHAEGEYVLVDTMPERAALTAEIVRAILARPHAGTSAD